MPFLQLKDISLQFEQKKILEKINLSVSSGEVLCLLGASGSGKTSLLRIIAGLQQTLQGEILLNRVNISHKPPHKRNFGMMFQDLALFPHENVFNNIAFGLKIQKKSKAEIKNRVEEVLSLVKLSDYANRSINTLSGGQSQRVALARSLAPNPQLLMLDEPLGSLDASLREQLTHDLHNIIKGVGVTSIFVTHDHKEAFAIADKIAILDNGCLKQIDSPVNICKKPANVEVAKFLGFHNLLRGEVVKPGYVKTEIGTLKISDSANASKNCQVLIKPDAASTTIPQQSQNIITATIKRATFQGSLYKMLVQIDGENGTEKINLAFNMPLNTNVTIGSQIKIHLNPQEMLIL